MPPIYCSIPNSDINIYSENEYDFIKNALEDYRRSHLRTVYTFTSTGETRYPKNGEWFKGTILGGFSQAAEDFKYAEHEIFTLVESTVSV